MNWEQSRILDFADSNPFLHVRAISSSPRSRHAVPWTMRSMSNALLSLAFKVLGPQGKPRMRPASRDQRSYLDVDWWTR